MSRLYRAGRMGIKVVAIAVMVILLLWLGVKVNHKFSGLHQWFKDTWYAWLMWRVMIYVGVLYLIRKIVLSNQNQKMRSITRLLIILIAVAEFANFMQFIN